MKKRLLSILLICVLAANLMPTAAFAAAASNYNMATQPLTLKLEATGAGVEGAKLTYDESLTEYGLSYTVSVDMSPIQAMYMGLKQIVDTPPTGIFSDYVTFSGGFKLTLTVPDGVTINESYITDEDLTTMAHGAFSSSSAPTEFNALFSVGDASWSGNTAAFTILFNDGITGKSVADAGGIPASITFTAPDDLLTYPQSSYPETGTLTAEAALTESSFVIGIPNDPNGTGSNYQTSLQNKVNLARTTTDPSMALIATLAKKLFPAPASEPITGLNIPVVGETTNELTLAKPLAPPVWKTSKSKTATTPDSNDESRVTLSLPANEEALASDIVFVMDGSSCSNAVIEEMGDMLTDLKASIGASKATVNVGVVFFRGAAQTVYPLTVYTGDNTPIETALTAGIATFTSDEILKGSNLPSGLLAAQDMLDDSDTDDSRQFLIFLSDGATYLYTHNGDPSTHFGRTSGYKGMNGNLYEWAVKYKNNSNLNYLANLKAEHPLPTMFTNGGDAADWSSFLTYIAANRGNFTQYDCEYTRTATIKNPNMTPPDPPYTAENIGSFITNVEESIYQTTTVWNELTQAGVKCYAIDSKTKDMGVFTSLMKYLGETGRGAASDFGAVTNDILYLLSAGSTIVDEMGSGTDDRGNAFNFDFVNDPEKLTLLVGDTKYSCAASSETLPTGETARYLFTSDGVTALNGAEAPYVLHYYKYGTGANGECFVLDINVSVTNFNRVQLVYSAKLTDPQGRASSTVTYSGLSTNNSATLFPMDSNGDPGPSEIFEKPMVSYTVSGTGGATNYTLTFDTNGGTALPPVTRREGSVIQLTQTTSKSGYIFDGWYSDEDLTKKATSVTMNNHVTVYAKWTATDAPEQFREDHMSYVIGYPDGNVRPEGNITRGETATIFFRLMTDASRSSYWMTTNRFPDVSSAIWFNNAVSTMANAGFINGYPDGNFGGSDFITRAEFAVIAARASGADGEYTDADKFTDISGHWAAGYIGEAVEMGLIDGYTDGSFKPNAYITRAEAMTIVNRFLGRDKVDSTSLLSGMITWPDNMSTSAWYYYAVQEATNSHDFTRQSNGVETWTMLTLVPDWEALEKTWSTANSAK